MSVQCSITVIKQGEEARLVQKRSVPAAKRATYVLNKGKTAA